MLKMKDKEACQTDQYSNEAVEAFVFVINFIKVWIFI